MQPFAIAAAQTASVRGDVAENVRRHVEAARLARRHGADAIVFPELSLTGYEPDLAARLTLTLDDDALRPLRALVEESGITIVAGCPIASGGDRPHIGAMIFQPGAAVAAYRKRCVATDEEPYCVGSNDSTVVGVRSQTLGLAICADIGHPEHSAAARAGGATIYAAGVMITPEDLARAEARMAGHALRHGMPALMANHAEPASGYATGGCSAVWDTCGERLARAEAAGEYLVLLGNGPAGWTGTLVLL